MFQTLSMDVKPIATVNAPSSAAAPTSAGTGVAPSSHDQAPPANTAPATSAGPASPHDASQGEEVTNGHGGSRRPGNLWTAEDREDMFNRRERGEGWETICADYPNRSRHAMQQQYSMMKKQKALADGTWASNRRGRKRRNPIPERAPTAVKRNDQYADGDEHMTEADDFDEGSSDDPEDHDDPNAKMGNGRPNPLMRSSTEPAKSSRSRNAQSGAAGATPTNGNRASSQQADPDPSYGTGRQSKKRRLSGDQASNVQVSTPSDMAEYQPTNVMLDYDEVFAILRKGVEYARSARRALDQERSQRAASYASSLQRANRRANDAHDRFSWATYEHGENVKKIRAEAALTLKEKMREHTEAMEKLAVDHEAERRVQYRQAAAQASLIEELRKENNMLKLNPPNRERAMIERIEQLKSDVSVLEDAKRKWEATAKAEPQPSAGQNIGNAGANNAGANIENLALLESSVFGSSKLFTEDFDRISAMVSKFHEEFDDLGHKRTVQYLLDIVALKDAALSKIAQMNNAVRDLHQAFLNVAQKCSESKPTTTSTAAAAAPALETKALDDTTSPGQQPAGSGDPAPPTISIEESTPVATPASAASARPTPTERQPSPSKQSSETAFPPVHEERVPVASMTSGQLFSETPDVEMKDETPSALRPELVAPHPVVVNELPSSDPPLPAAHYQPQEDNPQPNIAHPALSRAEQRSVNGSSDPMQH